MHLWDLIGRYIDDELRLILPIPNGDPLPETISDNVIWIRLETNKSMDELQALMNTKYASITRPKC